MIQHVGQMEGQHASLEQRAKAVQSSGDVSAQQALLQELLDERRATIRLWNQQWGEIAQNYHLPPMEQQALGPPGPGFEVEELDDV